MNTNNRVDQIVAEFDSHELAEHAILMLGKGGLDVHDMTIVGRDYHTEEQPVGYINTGDRMLAWGKFGAFWGSIWGILFGSAILFIPGVGSVLIAGWIVTTLASALEGAALGGGIGAISAALTTIGVPKDSVVAYETAIKAGKFLIIVRGTSEEVELAHNILTPLGANSLEVSEHRVLVPA
jgi:uncharacterized membrane protein